MDHLLRGTIRRLAWVLSVELYERLEQCLEQIAQPVCEFFAGCYRQPAKELRELLPVAVGMTQVHADHGDRPSFHLAQVGERALPVVAAPTSVDRLSIVDDDEELPVLGARQ